MQMINADNLKDAKRMTALFNGLSEDDKTKVMVYASALTDKNLADRKKQKVRT